MPARKSQHTKKADRMAKHIVDSAKEAGRYNGREEEVAWRKVHKEMPKEAHRGSTRKNKSKSR
jgi:hypothetical protein